MLFIRLFLYSKITKPSTLHENFDTFFFNQFFLRIEILQIRFESCIKIFLKRDQTHENYTLQMECLGVFFFLSSTHIFSARFVPIGTLSFLFFLKPV